MENKSERYIEMLELVVGITGIVVTVISIIVTVINIQLSINENKHQKSNRSDQS